MKWAYLITVASGLAIVCAASPEVRAATVTYTQDTADFTSTAGPNQLPGSSFNPTPASVTGTVITNETGESPGQYRSPFENAAAGNGGVLLSDGGYGVPGWSSLAYTSIQGGGSATYNFANGATGLSLLWGSPDSFNTLTFYSGLNGDGTDLYSITGSALDLQTLGHDLVDFTMSGGTFESVILSSSENAFELADLQDSPAPTPLPATLALFATGLGLMGLLASRKKQWA